MRIVLIPSTALTSIVLGFFKDPKQRSEFTTPAEIAFNFLSFAIDKDPLVDLELAQSIFDRFVKNFNQLGTAKLSGIFVSGYVSDFTVVVGRSCTAERSSFHCGGPAALELTL
jgi:hypothetical protein